MLTTSRTVSGLPRFTLAAMAALGLLAGCTSRTTTDWAHVNEITPAFLDSIAAREPAITSAAGGRIALTWVTRDSVGRDLWLSVSGDSGATFGPAQRINTRRGGVVSFPEGRPLPVFGPRGVLAVIWSERRADTTGAVDVHIRTSADGGAVFGPVVAINDDAQGPPQGFGWTAARQWTRANRPSAFHGFPTATYLEDGSIFAAWLDERRAPDTGGEPLVSSLFHSRSLDGGRTWSANAALQDSACPCCRPHATAERGRVALAYRSARRLLRDPALAVSEDGGATFARDTVVHHDRWYLEACPDQGTLATWSGDRGGQYAWYTGAGEGGVFVMPWREDAGPAGPERRVSDGVQGARSPRLVTMGERTLIGVEGSPAADTTRRVLALRGLSADGALTPWLHLGAAAHSGWLAGEGPVTALACWMESGSASDRLRVARISMRR